MRLGLRIGFFVGLTAILPLFLVAFAATQVARNQVEGRIVDFQVETARSLGSVITRQLGDTQRVLVQQVANFRLGESSDDVRGAFLLATYRLFPEISIVVLLDADGGELTAPLYQPVGPGAELAEHDLVGPTRLARFRASIPAPGPPGAVVLGEPYRPEDAEAAVIPMVFTSPWGDGVALAVELSLAPVASRMSALAEDREICLLARDGEVLLRSGRAGLVEPARTKPLLGNAEVDIRYETAGGVPVVAALARVPDSDWAVVIAEPADAVTATVAQIQARTSYIAVVALLVVLVAGAYLTRSITGPVGTLSDAAAAVARGEFARTEMDGRDELAELARAFDRMSASLEHNAQEIAAKNAEIERFNQELQARVETRTAQLREAQSRLVQSGQLAAVGELSSGLAHELNNPIAGILGIVQILSMKLGDRPEGALLRSAEQEALRCKEIVANLLRFTRPDGPKDPSAGDVVDLAAVVQDVLTLVGGALRQRGIVVELSTVDGPMPVRGDATQLGRALGQLLTSLRSIAAPGAALRIDVGLTEREVELRFEVAPTVSDNDDWRAAGLGFWVARQVFQEHAATLEEPQGERGGVRTWRLRAPRAGAS